MKLVDSLTGPYGHEVDVYYNEQTGGYSFVKDVGVAHEIVDTTLTSVFELRIIVEWLEGRTHAK